MKGHLSVCLFCVGFVFLVLEGREKETREKLWNGKEKLGGVFKMKS